MSDVTTMPYAGTVLPSIFGGATCTGLSSAAAAPATARLRLVVDGAANTTFAAAADAWLAGSAGRTQHAAKQIDVNHQGRPRGPEPV